MTEDTFNRMNNELLRIQAQLRSFMAARFLQEGVAKEIMALEKKEQELLKEIRAYEHEKARNIEH